jgi:hypothetical protein
MRMRYDDWQWKYAEHYGNTAARIGRQSGKSEGEALRLGLFCLNYVPPKEGLHLLITGGVERQAYELYQKLRRWLEAVAPSAIQGKPQEKKLVLKSGLIIRALPCGRDGAGLRNYAAAKIAVDEAHYVEDAVFVAIEPMLLTTMGTMDLMSTTRGNKGRFREAFEKDSGFETLHFKTMEVIQNREICDSWTEAQRDFAIGFIEKKQKQMTKNQFKQEFEAEFLDSLQAFFPSKQISPLMVLDPKEPEEFKRYVEGQDVAGWGVDDGAYITMEMMRDNKMEMRDILVTEETSTRETIKIMRQRLKKWKHKQWIMDSGAGGGGGAIFDLLVDDREFRNKIVGINNASKTVDHKSGRKKAIIKEDLYNNAKRMMEAGEVLLLKDDRLWESLTSIQFEWTDSGNFRIFGSNSHLAEAFIRACWFVKCKQLNIMAFC